MSLDLKDISISITGKIPKKVVKHKVLILALVLHLTIGAIIFNVTPDFTLPLIVGIICSFLIYVIAYNTAFTILNYKRIKIVTKVKKTFKISHKEHIYNLIKLISEKDVSDKQKYTAFNLSVRYMYFITAQFWLKNNEFYEARKYRKWAAKLEKKLQKQNQSCS